MKTDTEILDVAGRLLAARPAATMDDIATAAGVGRATLFRRFPARNDLVDRLCRDGVTDYVAAVDGAAPEQGPPEQALRRVAAALAGLAPRHGMLLLQPLPDLLEAELLARAGEADRRLQELVRRGQADGSFRLDLPPAWVLTAATWLVAGAADGLRLGVVAVGDVERLVVETLLGAVRPVPGARA